MPVAVGCSASSVAAVLEAATQARSHGAVAAMVAAPTLLRDVDALPRFYAAVAADAGLPLIVQDEPAATGVVVPVSILLASLRAAGARTVKLEDPPTPPKIGRLLAGDPGLAVFGGLGGAAALWELERGACGTMTGFAFPEILRAIREAIEAGAGERAGRLFDRYLPLIAFEAQPVVGLSIRKEVLRRRGAIDHATTRGTPGPLDPPTRAALDALFARLGIRPSLEPLRPGTLTSAGWPVAGRTDPDFHHRPAPRTWRVIDGSRTHRTDRARRRGILGSRPGDRRGPRRRGLPGRPVVARR